MLAKFFTKHSSMCNINSIQLKNNQTCPNREVYSKQINEHRFCNELEAQYWLGLKFSFPPEGLLRLVHALSILNGRLPGSPIPLLYNILSNPALLSSYKSSTLLCLQSTYWQGCDHKQQLGDHYGGLGKSCSFHCPSPGFNLLNRLIRIERA